MKNKNKSASSLILALGLVLIMSLLVLYILEYIIPYSKNVKGIENSTNAFFQTESSVEDGLKYIKDRNMDVANDVAGKDLRDEKSTNFLNNKISSKYFTTSSGNIIPPLGQGNSPYSGSFNTISVGNPIQLEVGRGLGIDWDNANTKINFQVPNISSISNTLSGIIASPPIKSTPIINWQLITNSSTLNATGSWITSDDINGGEFSLGDKPGIDLEGNNGSNEIFNTFYRDNCINSGSGCVLKMFVIKELILDSGNISIPFLEYKIKFNTQVPLRFSRINSTGKSYGFQKKLEVLVPQQTTNEAFGFTIMQ